MKELIIGANTIKKARRILENGNANIYTHTRENIMDGRRAYNDIPGNAGDHTLLIPDGYKVVYTVDCLKADKYSSKNIYVKHLSVSVTGGTEKYPSIAAVEGILALFDMPNMRRIKEEGAIFEERNVGDAAGELTHAINILHPITEHEAFKNRKEALANSKSENNTSPNLN